VISPPNTPFPLTELLRVEIEARLAVSPTNIITKNPKSPSKKAITIFGISSSLSVHTLLNFQRLKRICSRSQKQRSVRASGDALRVTFRRGHFSASYSQ
jgi:hypothetical protein